MSHRFIALLIVLTTLLSSMGLRAQAAPPAPNTAQLINELQRATHGAARISYHAQTGLVRFIGATPDQPIVPQGMGAAGTATPEQAARNFVQQFGPLFGLRDQQDLRAERSVAADRGRAFVRFQQLYQGVPILGAELNVQTNARGATISAGGELLPDISLSTTPAIDEQAAQQQAAALVARQYGLPENTLRVSAPRLWIYHPALLGGPGLQRAVLVWRMDVSAGPLDPINELVLIDAQRGVVALHFNQIAAARERYVCDKNNVRSSSDACTVGAAERSEGAAPTGVQDVDLAYDYTGATYDFFKARFDRDSLDGNGLPLFSTVRFCPTTGPCPYQNAYWNGAQMVYGEGFAAADDVVAHELAHGLTQFTSNLFYYYQSGAINESLSDVFGELIDQAYGGASNDDPSVRWRIGEDLPASIGVIRDMADPPNPPNPCATPSIQPCNPRQPDKMSSPLYDFDPALEDNGGVHANSGINNKAAYLLTDGGAFNGVTISGLGGDKVAQIYYEAAANLLLSASDYADLADALQQACTNLIGTRGVTAADCAQVTGVVQATEMSQQPHAVPAPAGPLCNSGLPGTIFFDDLENPQSGNWSATTITGAQGWYYPQNSHNIRIPNGPKLDSTYPTSGIYNMWGDDPAKRNDSAIGMTFDRTLPPNAYFRFNHAYGFDDFTSSGNQTFYDGGVIEYSTNRGASWKDARDLITDNGYNGAITTDEDNPLKGRAAFVGQSNGYISSRLDLSTLAGQTVRFRFRIGTDSAYGDYGWYIDDLRLYTCTENGPGTRAYIPLAFR